MRRALVLLVAALLVNLPFVHEAAGRRELAREGTSAVAEVMATRTVGDDGLVDYRLPADLDPGRTRYSARVDASALAVARETGQLRVRVVRDEPGLHRVEGAVRSRMLLGVAGVADAVLLLGALAAWRRRSRWRLHEVLELDDGTARLRWRELTVTAAVPPGWSDRVRAGDQVPGSLHLAAEGDVVPAGAGSPLPGLEQVDGASYAVRGRVRDARAGRVDLEVGDGLVLRVETGPHRIRADLRDLAQVSGSMAFTPS